MPNVAQYKYVDCRGATQSHIVLFNATGKILATASGPETNPHSVGLIECQNRISDLVNTAKDQAGIPLDKPIHALGLSLSGCEQDEANRKLEQSLIARYPNISEHYLVGSDTDGSIATISNQGGITCIAGTGSNTILMNPDGKKVQCGGWGYLLSDEGSAWQISHRAIRICFQHVDNLELAPFPPERLWQTVKDHFEIVHQADIFSAFYTNFSKARIASLCQKLATLANEGDELCQFIFNEAGELLAKQINAVITHPKTDVNFTKAQNFRVLCVGSVWLSWNLLQKGFISWLHGKTAIQTMALLRSTSAMGTGAAYMIADRLHLHLRRTYDQNCTVFYQYDREKHK